MVTERWIDQNTTYLYTIIFIIGIVLRIVFLLLSLNGSVTPEEALTGVQAESFLHTGRDIYGVYLPAFTQGWGEMQRGMLLPIISIPFLQIFGHTAFALRLPMLIMSIIQLWLIFAIVRNAFGNKPALIILIIFSLLPWHVLACTYASQIQVMITGYILGIYFLIKSKEKRNIYLASICFAITMYTSDIAWVPCAFMFLIGIFSLYFIKYIDVRSAFKSVVLWIVLSIPALATLFVNVFDLSSFTIFNITIPYFENWEHLNYAFNQKENDIFKNILEVIYFILLSVFEDDYAQVSMYLPSNNGLYYAWFIPALFAGVAMCLSYLTCRKQKSKKYLVFLFITVASVCVLVSTCIFGAPDVLHMFPVLLVYCILCSIGFIWLSKRMWIAKFLVVIMSVISFVPFAVTYIDKTYEDENKNSLAIGFIQAAYEMQHKQVDEYIVTDYFFPHVNPGMAAKIEVAFSWNENPNDLDSVKVMRISDETFKQDGVSRAYIIHDNDWQNISVDIEENDFATFGNFTLISPMINTL